MNAEKSINTNGLTSRSTVLVTGGAGYVGSHCAYRLRAEGHAVVVLDDLSTGHEDAVRWGPFVRGDVGDPECVRATIRQHDVTAVMHFAAKSIVGESVREPALYDAWNRGKMEALAEAAREEGVQAFVFSSTAAVYGEPPHNPITEDAPLVPTNPYGASKIACEKILKSSGLPAIALRYFNACGGLVSERLAERHDPETHLIPLAIAAARTGSPLTIFGTDYPTPDGTCVRDYIHVLDLADAHIAALRHLEGGGAGGAWNLGTGVGASVRQVLDALGRVLGTEVPAVIGDRRPGDPAMLVAAAAEAERVLGWQASRSGLDQIARDAVACHDLFHGPA